eukprot:g16011.t1
MGSMAIASCLGAQTLNICIMERPEGPPTKKGHPKEPPKKISIPLHHLPSGLAICIGLGLPWTMVAIANKPILLHPEHNEALEEGIKWEIYCVGAAVGVILLLTVIWPLAGGSQRLQKVELRRSHSFVTLCMYFGICGLLGYLTFVANANSGRMSWEDYNIDVLYN